MIWNTHDTDLPIWAQQLSSILPLSALIEFIDIGSKLHISQLTGSVPPWQWPVTPSGARLLFAVKPSETECVLDHPERSALLECFDTRHGDAYPSSTPTTTRLWMASQRHRIVVDNRHLDKQHPGVRPQKLQLFCLQFEGTAKEKSTTRLGAKMNRSRGLSAFGWLLWVSLVVVSVLCQLWFAAAYLLFVVLTGLIILNTHGGPPRKVLNGGQYGKHDRLIVTASSRNSLAWSAFHGESVLLNGLLNRPLLQRRPSFWPELSLALLQVLILCQWITVLAASAITDWNAYVVSSWIVFCSVSSAYLYTPSYAARDWLLHDCQVSVKSVEAEFSSRRAMLGALVYLSPDTASGHTSWMDPILSKSSKDREDWETALLQAVRADRASATQAPVPTPVQQGPPEYWRKWIGESIEVGRKMKQELQHS